MIYLDNLFDMYNIADTFKEKTLSIYGVGRVAREYRIFTYKQNKFSRKVFLRHLIKKAGQFEHLVSIFNQFGTISMNIEKDFAE